MSSWGVHTTSTTLHIPFDIKISFVQPSEYLIAHRSTFSELQSLNLDDSDADDTSKLYGEGT